MGRVFLSYRREDSLDVSGRIFDRLAAHFGRESVFMDVDTIPFGVDFRAHFAQWIASCDVVLVVIGDGWTNAAYREGAKQGRRLDDPTDFVRIEVSTALERGVPVIPVLVGGGVMPTPAELPDELESLAYRNAAEVRSGRDFHGHMDRLIRGIEQVLDLAPAVPPPTPRPPTPAPEPVATIPGPSDERSLADLLAQRVAVPEPIALQIVIRALDQLDVDAPHFDPRCVLLGPATAEPVPYLADVPSGELPGDYSAPRAEHGDAAAAAIYTAGQVLWELIMGRPAFTGSPNRVRAVKRRQPASLSLTQTAYHVTAATETLIARATHPHPDMRPKVLELMELAAQVTPELAPPMVVTPVNMSFAGEIVAGFPHGWFNGLGHVARVSVAYGHRTETVDGRACVRMYRRGAHADEFGTLMQRVPASHLRGRDLRLRGELATDDLNDWCSLWLRADGPPITRGSVRYNDMLSFENMHDRPIRGTTPWTTYEIELCVPEATEWLNYGVLMNRDGTVRAANLDLLVRGHDNRWQSLAWETLGSVVDH